MNIFERTEILIGKQGVEHLQSKHILVAGLGGVGGFAAEALARAGIGKLTLLDHDTVAESNLNRQIIALQSTIGQAKTKVLQERLLNINPKIQIIEKQYFLYPDQVETLVLSDQFDFIADCIDSIACKAALVGACRTHNIPIISSLGSGGRLDPGKIKIVTNINQTKICPLAREMRAMLKKLQIPLNYPVVYSEEQPIKALPHQPVDGPSGRARAVNGTISYMPAMFGLMVAGYIIQRLLEK